MLTYSVELCFVQVIYDDVGIRIFLSSGLWQEQWALAEVPSISPSYNILQWEECALSNLRNAGWKPRK